MSNIIHYLLTFHFCIEDLRRVRACLREPLLFQWFCKEALQDYQQRGVFFEVYYILEKQNIWKHFWKLILHTCSDKSLKVNDIVGGAQCWWKQEWEKQLFSSSLQLRQQCLHLQSLIFLIISWLENWVCWGVTNIINLKQNITISDIVSSD